MKVIQMGMGGMGDAWIKQLSALDFVEYVGFVEVNDQIAHDQAELYELNPSIIFRNLPDALEQVQADLVISIIPPEFRIETLQTCIDAKVPLMAEKPLADSLESAYTQLRMAQESGLVYVIAQNYRYKPGPYTVKSILDSGKLGAIDSVTVSHYWGFEFTGFRAEMPYPLLTDMAVHHFDLMRYFLGTEATRLYGITWSPPWNRNSGKMAAHALLTFEKDVHVAYTTSWASNGLPSTFEGDWRFECEKGELTYINDVISIQFRDGLEGKNFTYHPAEKRDFIPMPYAHQAYLMNEFNEYILTGKLPATIVQDNIKTFEMSFDVIKSSETGETIHKA
ncbi:Gfo/Idh/MocA family oxidoreductase [Anaerolineales bacterium]